MKRCCIFLMVIICMATTVSRAQDTLYFKEGFMANGIHKYGREALYTDLLVHQMYNNELKQPVDGGVLGKGSEGEEIKWTAVTADSLNRFRLPRPTGGVTRRGGGGMFSNSSYLYVSYTADKEKNALLNTKGSSTVYVNGEPHAGDPYASGWLYIPVKLKKGLNEFYIRSGFGTSAALIFPKKTISLNTQDPTIPVLVLQQDQANTQGAVVVLNTTAKTLSGLTIKSVLSGKAVTTSLPVIPAMSSRKVPFSFDGTGISSAGKYDIALSLLNGSAVIDEQKTGIEVVTPGQSFSNTFISDIDGSLQYYGVTPQSSGNKTNSALFLSVHGAGVEAIGQARAYRPKDWGNLITATNRRPRGFNWEDWGRLDALEVFNIGKKLFNPDPQKIYLTGHSMGGHGTWYLGATYPDQWAAIAPCAGYPTLKEYGSHDGKIPDSTESPAERLLLRAGNQSDVVKLAENYKPLGVYIFHGDSDRVVSVNYARQMRKVLADFHPDYAYNEYPGGSHWFGDHSVDWAPLFDFFKSHTILHDSAVNNIDFKTSSPGISATFRWATIYQQEFPLQFSRVQLNRNLATRTISGKTDNVSVLKLRFTSFPQGDVKIVLDSLNTMSYAVKGSNDSIYLAKQNNQWVITTAPAMEQKGPHRYGTFKEPFNHKMVFVYGTTGNKAENDWAWGKARYDAETWYYRGNGAVDIISDKEYATGKYADRGVVLYGNAQTNSAWPLLLSDAPIQIQRNTLKASGKTLTGDDIAAYFVWPIKNATNTSVAVISGTGLKGMNAANANQYFAGGSGFPDYMLFRLDMLREGSKAIEAAGFFNNEWKLDEKNGFIK